MISKGIFSNAIFLKASHQMPLCKRSFCRATSQSSRPGHHSSIVLSNPISLNAISSNAILSSTIALGISFMAFKLRANHGSVKCHFDKCPCARRSSLDMIHATASNSLSEPSSCTNHRVSCHRVQRPLLVYVLWPTSCSTTLSNLRIVTHFLSQSQSRYLRRHSAHPLHRNPLLFFYPCYQLKAFV